MDAFRPFPTTGMKNTPPSTITAAVSRSTASSNFSKRMRSTRPSGPVMWDIDFQTAIAQAEVVDKEMHGAFYYLRFGVQDGDRRLTS